MFFRNDMILMCCRHALCKNVILNWLLCARDKWRRRQAPILATLFGSTFRRLHAELNTATSGCATWEAHHFRMRKVRADKFRAWSILLPE